MSQKVSSQKNGREIGNRKSHMGVSLRRGGRLGGGFILNRIRLSSRPTCLLRHGLQFEIILLLTLPSYDFNYEKYAPTTFSTFHSIFEEGHLCVHLDVCLFVCSHRTFCRITSTRFLSTCTGFWQGMDFLFFDPKNGPFLKKEYDVYK